MVNRKSLQQGLLLALCIPIFLMATAERADAQLETILQQIVIMLGHPQAQQFMAQIEAMMAELGAQTVVTTGEALMWIEANWPGGVQGFGDFLTNLPDYIDGTGQLMGETWEAMFNLYNTVFDVDYAMRWWSDRINNWLSGLNGGMCPTFVQPPPGGMAFRAVPRDEGSALVARIASPTEGCLLRCDIPIFGLACGERFDHYVVDVGKGEDPKTWTLVEESRESQWHFDSSLQRSLLQGDLDIRGNLATWNTGLRNWEHLPWHPASDSTDLKGLYTIRLRTYDGADAFTEDRVVCEAGGVVAQCLPGIVTSDDKQLTLHFSEQSLMTPFRVYSIRSVDDNLPVVPDDEELVGLVYQIREPGDRFIKSVTLAMNYEEIPDDQDLSSRLGIFCTGNDGVGWRLLPSERNEEERLLTAELHSLPPGRALFAVMRSLSGVEQSSRSGSSPAIRQFASSREVEMGEEADDWRFEDFEEGLGEWCSRDLPAGAEVRRVVDDRDAQNQIVEVVNVEPGGNAACTVFSTRFNAREFPELYFDYRILPDVSLNLYLLAGGTWFEIALTGGQTEWRNKNVNVVGLGTVEGIVADGEWHDGRVDLYGFLRGVTRRFDIEQVVLADWEVGNFMELRFGSNPQGPIAWFDDVELRGTSAPKQSPPVAVDLLVETFDRAAEANLLQGSRAIFASRGDLLCGARTVERQEETGRACADGALRLEHGVMLADEYFGWVTSLEGVNLEGENLLELDLRRGEWVGDWLIGLKGRDGTEAKVPLAPYLPRFGMEDWGTARIPLNAFGTLSDWRAMDNLSISFESGTGADAGFVELDNVIFRATAAGEDVLWIDRFDGTQNENNALGQGRWIFRSGAAAVHAEVDATQGYRASEASLRISFGGSIGLDLGEAGFSYAGWATGLGGIDASDYQAIRFAIRAHDGDESFNLYLDDGNRRASVPIADYAALTNSWQTIAIPLQRYAEKGIDLTHLDELQVVFEWQEMSGTLWIDEIGFVPISEGVLVESEIDLRP